MIGGVPCSGKSTLTRNILSELGSAEFVEPMKLFPCQKHGDTLVVGRYPVGETFGGTDRISYGAISKFRDFINQEVSKHKNIILEGDRFCRAKDIEWLLSEHNSKVYILKVSPSVEKERHIGRGDEQSEKWLQTRRSLIANLQTNFLLMGELAIRQTDTEESLTEVKNEIKENLA
tara:strand:+ start:19 stop:543 length:525 start_codon:yes stop_codon:yes gene_type:complete